MIPDEKACVARTGFNGGLDIIFGNGSFGMNPPLGSTIDVIHLITNGQDGNIFRRTVNDWKFVDDILDGYGNPVEVTKIFDVLIFNDINFGANKESITFTKNILPIVSNNFVLGLPQQYAYEIKKLGVFSHVNAYEDNSIIDLLNSLKDSQSYRKIVELSKIQSNLFSWLNFSNSYKNILKNHVNLINIKFMNYISLHV
jgi:hypothetical protein